MKVVRLSALSTGRLYPPGNIAGTNFCYRLCQLQGHSAAGRVMSMKNSYENIGNRTRDIPACSEMPQLRHHVALHLQCTGTNLAPIPIHRRDSYILWTEWWVGLCGPITPIVRYFQLMYSLKCRQNRKTTLLNPSTPNDHYSGLPHR